MNVDLLLQISEQGNTVRVPSKVEVDCIDGTIVFDELVEAVKDHLICEKYELIDKHIDVTDKADIKVYMKIVD